MTGPGILFAVIGAILFVIAYFLYFKEAYWLISGVNFHSRRSAYERYNIPGLTKHMGRMCFLLGLIMMVAGAGAFTGSEMFMLIPMGFIFIMIPAFLFGTERYMITGRKTQRIINIIITLFMAAVAVFVIATMVTGVKGPDVRITDESLIIESAYRAEIPLDTIRQVDMVNLEGRKTGKIDGFNLGNHLAGRFAVEGLSIVMLYQKGEPCNSVMIKTNGETYLINLGSEAENKKLWSQITDAVK